MKASHREINEFIKSIEKVSFQKINSTNYFGFIITLEDSRKIKIFQEQVNLCCEQYDIIILNPFYEDDPNISPLKELDNMKGTHISGISWGKELQEEYTAQLKNKTEIFYKEENKEYYCYVDLFTDKGLIQVVCFNFHHGNYPHDIYVEWDNFKDLEHI